MDTYRLRLLELRSDRTDVMGLVQGNILARRRDAQTYHKVWSAKMFDPVGLIHVIAEGIDQGLGRRRMENVIHN